MVTKQKREYSVKSGYHTASLIFKEESGVGQSSRGLMMD